MSDFNEVYKESVRDWLDERDGQAWDETLDREEADDDAREDEHLERLRQQREGRL